MDGMQENPLSIIRNQNIYGIETYTRHRMSQRRNQYNKSGKIFTITSEKYSNVEFLRRKHNACMVHKPDNCKTHRIYIGISSNISSQPAQIQAQEQLRGALIYWGKMSKRPSSRLIKQADRDFARSRLCTNEDGNTNNLVLYTVRNDTSKKGGNALQATD